MPRGDILVAPGAQSDSVKHYFLIYKFLNSFLLTIKLILH